jgi:hypothetical protein
MKASRILIFLGVVGVASATSIGNATFNFNSLAENASTTSIQTYMNGVLSAAGCSGCTVTVTGAFADTMYNADGHVTGPGSAGSGGTAAKSLTLGTSGDGGTPIADATASNLTSSINSSYDTFLATTNDGATQTGSQITLKFSGFTVSGATSFAYEIFPDNTCPVLNSSSCGGNPTGGIYPNQPDFKFDINGSTPVSTFGTNGVQYGITPGTGTDGNTNNSPLSSAELAPQYIGTWSGSINTATEMDFVDWPATIGVDDLVVNWTKTSSPVPEPGSVLLLGTIAAGLAFRKKLRKLV